MVQRKPIIGLVGGIGAGKTRVAAEFACQGCVVIDSDRLNHEALRRPEVKAQLADWWGPDVLDAAGEPNRRRIAEIVFRDPAAKERLERLVYPLIAAARAAIIQSVEGTSAVKAIVVDSPLLLEANLDRECDTVVFVHASENSRLERLKRERGWTAEEVTRRARWQRPLAEKQARAEFVVDNDGAPERLTPQVADILQTILARFAR